ncbi:MAG: serine/threonine-protein kinase, partial [Planctomycetota bacterium]
MPLAAGQALSFYEILGPLGAGGMGEVYLARDTRLEREVAIKVLPEEFADDEERLRRFEREAKTLASLNHPNVAGIHGIDQVDDTCFLAMELVSGEDLEERLKRGALPLEEALDVCRQIAEGLEAAHEAGVIHRDLKPASGRVTPRRALTDRPGHRLARLGHSIALGPGFTTCMLRRRAGGWADLKHAGAPTRRASTDSGVRAVSGAI